MQAGTIPTTLLIDRRSHRTTTLISRSIIPILYLYQAELNITLLMNNQKQIYFGKAYDYGNNRPLAYPSSMIEALMKAYASFFEQPDASFRKQGLLIVDKKPLIAASYPILTSNNEGPVHGTLVFARFLDSNYIRYISEKRTCL